jgi:predicted nucleotidyltransferase/biotin operon repressor
MVCIDIDFLGNNHFCVIELLLKRDYCIREIAEELKLAPSSVHKITRTLKSKGVLVEERKKNRVFFKINYGSALAREAVRTLFVARTLSTKAFKKLIELKPQSIYLFGSASKGTLSQKSDLDLAAFFKKPPTSLRISEIRMGLSNELLMEVDLFALNKKNYSSGNEKPESIKNIENGILLYGNE